jgi:hypothetical protein
MLSEQEKEKSGEEQIKEQLSSVGMKGGLIKSGKFDCYYFLPDGHRDIYFRLENLIIKKLY